MVLNSIPPLAMGRELWGIPKKFADVTFEWEDDFVVATMERPQGNRICIGVMRPEVPIDPSQIPQVASLFLRIIRSPEEGAEPSLVELIQVPVKYTITDLWQGFGSLQFSSTSTMDPWHKLSVKKILSATYKRAHIELGYGTILKRY
jgi:acetoacetate decarboxylase